MAVSGGNMMRADDPDIDRWMDSQMQRHGDIDSYPVEGNRMAVKAGVRGQRIGTTLRRLDELEQRQRDCPACNWAHCSWCTAHYQEAQRIIADGATFRRFWEAQAARGAEDAERAA